MNTLVFDQQGNCLYSMNYQVEPESYSDAGMVLHVEQEFTPNTVWFDYEKNRMSNKTDFEEAVTTNTISNLPIGTFVDIGGEELVVDDGVFEIIVTAPQTVVVGLRHVQHNSKMLEVSCEV